MLRIVVLVAFLALSVFSSGFSLPDWGNSLFTLIKNETIKGLEVNFNTRVKIGKISGPIIGQVVFEDVSAPGFARVKRITVNYNLLKFAYFKDVVPAISRITLDGGEFTVARNKADRLNVLDLLKTGDPNAPPPPPFFADLVFQNCRVIYQDQLGFQSQPASFSEHLYSVNGRVSFAKKDTISFTVSGNIDKNLKPYPVTGTGFVDFKTGRYQIDITAKKLDLTKWAAYSLPFAGVSWQGGEADLVLRILPPQTAGWPVSLIGRFTFFDAAAKLEQYQIAHTSGTVSLVDDHLALKNVQTNINNLPLTVNGRFDNFSRQNLDLTIALQRARLEDLLVLSPPAKDWDLRGSADARFAVQGSVSNPQIKGELKFGKARFYNQDLGGQAGFSYQNKILNLELTGLKLYHGSITGTARVDLSSATPQLLVNTTLNQLDLAVLAQAAPGIEGKAQGTLTLAGPLTNLTGNLFARLDNALLLGQPIEALSAGFTVKDGGLRLKSFSASSETAAVVAQGTISPEMDFAFQAKAFGIKLTGQSMLGRMEALVDSFQGSLAFKLNSAFLAAPLKYIHASGEATLSQGRLGQQEFDSAQGMIAVGGSQIAIKDVTLKKGASLLTIAGKAGLGSPTRLEVAGRNISWQDFKIINYLLPAAAQDPSGRAEFDFSISGQLPEDTPLTSLEPFLQFDAQGEIRLDHTELAGLPINSGQIKFSWQKQTLNLSQCNLRLPNSDLALNLVYGPTGPLQGSFKGVLDLGYLRLFTERYGRLGGTLGLNLALSGTAAQPNVAANFWLDDFTYNSVEFDNIAGSITFQDNRLELPEPLRFTKGKDIYELSGLVNLEGWRQNQPAESSLRLKLKIVDAELSAALNLFESFRRDLARKLPAPTKTGRVEIAIPRGLLPVVDNFVNQSTFTFYSENNSRPSFEKAWAKIARQVQTTADALPARQLGGRLAGTAQLTGKIKNLSGAFEAEVKNGHYGNYNFDSLKGTAALRDQIIAVEKLVLEKDEGQLTAAGEFNFAGDLALSLSAKNLPLDALKIFFDEDFKGTLTLHGSVEGSLANPRFMLDAICQKPKIGRLSFDSLKLQLTKDEQQFYIREFSLAKGAHNSRLSGSLNFNPSRLSLNAELRDDALGLVNLLTPEIKWLSGKAFAKISAQGSLEDPGFAGKIFIKDAKVYVKALDSEIREISGEAQLANSLATISGLTGYWQGQRTKNYYNFLGLAGTVNLAKILARQPGVDLDLVLSPTHLYADLPNLFSGMVKISDAALTGPLLFDYSAGPKLRGQAEINNAVISVSPKNQDKKKTLPLSLELDLRLNKNVYAVMGEVWTADISNLFMNLEIRSDDLKISGTLAQPSLLGKVDLRRGTVNIFNREFTLLSAEQQKDFFAYDQDKLPDNAAAFSGEDGVAGTRPKVQITAKTEVEHSEKDANNDIVKKNVVIVSRLNGVLGATNKDEGLKTTFFSFSQEKDGAGRQYTPASYSEQDIKVMLLPDFIKSLTGLNQDDTSQVDTNAILADYLSSNIQTMLFRGLERDLEQKLGLESLTLEYNFGKELRQAMGVQEQRTVEGERPDWRVGFVKGLSDRLFVDVRYSRHNESGASAAETALDYQLTYKLSPIWSIIYYREPPSLEDLIAGYQKVTLQASVAFW